MPIHKEKWMKPLRMPCSCIFYDPAQSVRVLSRKYDKSMDIVHEHDFFELVFVKSGTGVHVTENGDYPLQCGDVYLIRPGFLHCYQDIQELEIINILYQPALLSLTELRNDPSFVLFFETKRGSYDARLRFNLEEMQVANQLVDEMIVEQQQELLNYKFAVKTFFMQFVLHITRALSQREINGIEEVFRFRHLLSYLDKHYSDPIKVGDIARKAGMSTRSLERIFKKLVGRSPWAYFTDLRLDVGARLLIESDMSISQIAYNIGLVDNGHFSKLFRRKFGCLPREYRQKSFSQKT